MRQDYATGIITLLACLLSSHEPIQAQERKLESVPIAPASSESTTDALIAALARPVTIQQPLDVALRDVLDHLQDLCGVNFTIDSRAFQDAEPPLEDVAQAKIKIPRLQNVRLDLVLRIALKPLGGGYLLRRNHIEITTLRDVFHECGELGVDEDVDDPDSPVTIIRPRGPDGPLVNVAFKSRQLHEVVRDLADAYPEFNIQLAPQAGAKARIPLSGRLINLPLRKALQTLAELSDLKLVPMTNVFLITTRERAEPLLREEAVKEAQLRLMVMGIRATRAQIQDLLFPRTPDSGSAVRRGSPVSWDDYARRVRERGEGNR